MAVDLSHFQESFFTESAEHVETMESGFLELEERPQDYGFTESHLSGGPFRKRECRYVQLHGDCRAHP